MSSIMLMHLVAVWSKQCWGLFLCAQEDTVEVMHSLGMLLVNIVTGKQGLGKTPAHAHKRIEQYDAFAVCAVFVYKGDVLAECILNVVCDRYT